jgi:branched-chain amino acid aminotransferase
MSVPLAYVNGCFLPLSEAGLPVHDAGVVFGATATDLARTFRHRLFRLPDHLARFRTTCSYLDIPLALTDAELVRIAEELVTHNAGLLPAEELALVLLATPGPIGFYAGESGGPGDARPTLILHTFPLPFARYGRLFQEGARLVIPPTRHIPAACVDPRAKQRSRLHWWRAEREARRLEPRAAALLLDLDGHVTETAAANFLLVRGGTVMSPARSTVLDGVSLRVTEELCGELGIPFAEQPLTVADCHTADEALLTGTAFCLAGVSRLDGRALTWPGPITEALAGAWARRVGLDYRAQFLAGR